MTNTITAPSALIASNATVEVQLPLGASGAEVWCELPGAAGTDVDNGERPINETETYKGTIIQTGEKTKPQITVNISSLLPHMRIAKEINKKFILDETLNIRWSTPLKVIQPLSQGANNNCDISTAGVVTFNAGVVSAALKAIGSNRVPEGVCLFTGTNPNQNDYVIEAKAVNAAGEITSLNVVDAATGAVPAVAVNDEAFGFRIPKVAQPEVACEIMSAGNLTGAVSQAGYSSQLVLRALHDLGEVVIESN